MTHLPFCSPLLSPLCPTIVYISPPLVSHLSLSSQFIPWMCLVAHTEPDYSKFPELIGVTLACQETQCHYGNAQSITGQWINTPSVISDFHICIGLMVSTRGCYLLGVILSASAKGTQQYGRGQLCHCWIVGLPWIRAFLLQMKNFNANLACHLSVERDDGLILSDFSVQTPHNLNCVPVMTPPSGYPM